MEKCVAPEQGQVDAGGERGIKSQKERGEGGKEIKKKGEGLGRGLEKVE